MRGKRASADDRIRLPARTQRASASATLRSCGRAGRRHVVRFRFGRPGRRHATLAINGKQPRASPGGGS